MDRRLIYWFLVLLAGLAVVVVGMLYWTQPDLFWPPVSANPYVEIVRDGAIVRFQCTKPQHEIWAEVQLTHQGCHSTSCLEVVDERTAVWVNPITGDINVMSRYAYLDLQQATPSRLCTRDCGTGQGPVHQVWLGTLAPGEHQVWIGDAWAGYIEIEKPPISSNESCLKLWYPITATVPPTYTPVYPESVPYPVDEVGNDGSGYP